MYINKKIREQGATARLFNDLAERGDGRGWGKGWGMRESGNPTVSKIERMRREKELRSDAEREGGKERDSKEMGRGDE